MRATPILAVLLVPAGCRQPEAEPAPAPAPAPERVLRLVWRQGWPDETWEIAKAGLWWGLSNAGAAPPADESGLQIVSASSQEVVFDLDLDAVGFPEGREAALDLALAPLLASDELAVFGAVDLGRALMATVHQPWYYAALTGVCPSWEDFEAARLSEHTATYAVTDSLLTEGDRLLRLRRGAASTDQIAMVAEEGEGSLVDGDFVALEREVLDVMHNGQFRYAVYDATGALIPAATVAPAGTAARCQWCHEDHLMPIMTVNTPVEGHLSYEQISAEIEAGQDLIEAARAADPYAVDFGTPEAHAWSELLVEMFLRAPPSRVAAEWGVPEEEAVAILDEAGLVAAEHEEYPEFGPLYARAELDALTAARAPDLLGVDGYAPLEVADSARELDPAEFDALPGAELLADLAPCAP